MLTADQESAAKSIVASLRRDVWVARFGSALTVGPAAAGMGAALDAVSDHLLRAETLWLDRVRNGEKDFAWWLAAVDEERKALEQYSDTRSSYGLIQSAASAASATAVDVAGGVKELVPAVNSSMKWLVVGAVAVAVVYSVSFLKGFRP